VRIAVREDDDVARLHSEWGVTFHSDPALTLDQHVEQRHALGTQPQKARELLRRRGFNRPRRGKPGSEKDGARQANYPQDIGKDIHALSLLSLAAVIPSDFGVSINNPGASVIDSFGRLPDTPACTRPNASS
jgi:hypothetical protein